MTGDARFADDAERYRLEAPIATGGMGEVWRGTDTVLERPVAVKLLRRKYAEDPDFRARFQTEARHAAALHDQHVAAVFDFGEATAAGTDGPATVGRPYLVMELVPGQPLSALLRAGRPMDPEVVRDLVGQAATGLGAAHALGIVHRDVKPANLLVTPEGRVKVTDFGIARAAESVALTLPGTVLGTPHYLSPEQARGETAGPASDVYGLGVVAFECLAGRRPFTADTPMGTALAHLRDPVPELPAKVPPALAAVVRRALAKSPSERFPDAGAFAEALHATGPALAAAPPAAANPPAPTQVLTGTPVTRHLPPPPAYTPAAVALPWWRRWWVAAAAVAAVVLVVALLASALGDPSTPDDQAADPSTAGSESSAASEVAVAAADYIGDPAARAEQELAALGLEVTVVPTENPGDRIAGNVSDVAPTGALPAGSAVTVTAWGPPPPDDVEEGDDGDEDDESPGKSKGKSKGKGRK